MQVRYVREDVWGKLDAYLGYFQPLLCALIDCIYWKEHAGPQLLCGWGFVEDKRTLLNVRWKYVFNPIISYEKVFYMVIAFAMALAGLFMRYVLCHLISELSVCLLTCFIEGAAYFSCLCSISQELSNPYCVIIPHVCTQFHIFPHIIIPSCFYNMLMYNVLCTDVHHGISFVL